jgi:hypothetical protein
MLSVAILCVVASYAEHHETFTPVTSPLGNDIYTCLLHYGSAIPHMVFHSRSRLQPCLHVLALCISD